MCNFDFYGECEFYSATFPRARRSHDCWECSHKIQPGERYARIAQKWEGSIDVNRVCLACHALGEELTEAQRRECQGHSGWELGRMWEYVAEFCREHLGYDPDDDEESEAA